MAPKRILFHTGGPDFHPTRWQAEQIASWLGEEYQCEIHDGAEAFQHLDSADLLVVMGLFWTGMEDYAPPTAEQKQGLESYLRSGRPLIVHHGAIASYDDWPEFGQMMGLQWVWGESDHGPVQEYRVKVTAEHAITRSIGSFSLVDEAYYGLRPASGLDARVLATTYYVGQDLPMLLCAHRPGPWLYIALGHDQRAFQAAPMKPLWTNAVTWARGQNA